MYRRWLAVATIAVVVLVIVPVVLLALAAPVAAPTSGPAQSAQSASPSAGTPTGIEFVDPATPEDAAWYRVGGDPGEFPPHIRIGTMRDGVTFEVEMPQVANGMPDAIVPQRVVVGVTGGIVVTVEDDGRRSLMRAVVASSGEPHDLLAADDVIVDAVLDGPGRTVYYVTADRLTGDLTGGWRLVVGDGRAQPAPIESLVADRPGIRLVAVSRFATRLMLSLDGSTLVLFRCVELDCVLRTVRTEDASLVGEVRMRRGGGEPMAVTDAIALLVPICPDGPECIPELVELATGAQVPMPLGAWQYTSEAVVHGDGGPALVIQVAGPIAPPEATGLPPGPPPEVAVIPLPEFRGGAHHAPPLSSLRIIPDDDYGVGVDLPSGWILIQGSEHGELTMGAYALNVADGSIVPLPALGEFFVQG